MSIIEEIDSVHKTVVDHMNPALVSGVVQRLDSIRRQVEAHLAEIAVHATLREEHAKLKQAHAALQKAHADLESDRATKPPRARMGFNRD